MSALFAQIFVRITATIVAFIVIEALAITLWIDGKDSLLAASAIAFPIALLAFPVARLIADPIARRFSELHESIESTRQDLASRHQEFEGLLVSISDAVVAVARNSTLIFFNPHFAHLFGGDRVRKKAQIYEYFRAPEVLECFSNTLANGTSSNVPAVPLDTSSGRRYFALSVSPLRKSQTEIHGAVGVFHDITDLKRAEQMRIDFVANVSHELRTPLTSIQGYAETIALDAEQGRPPEKDFVKAILRNSERLRLLMNDLLDLSSIESSEAFEMAVISTRALTDKVVSQMRPALFSKNREVVIDIEAEQVCGEPRRLEQVLTNLLDNANKYSPPGGKVFVRWISSQDHVVLEVADTGPGIPAEHHGRLFERFYRIDKSRSRDIGGTGLGLAIVKHILQRHGGSVSVRSTPGEGATFACEFPA